jgi:Sodium Bile acid symporter family
MTLIKVIGNVLVFCLVFGMSGTVDFSCFKTQLYNAKAIVPGLLLQFLLIPFLGFLVVMAIDMDHVSGLMILAVTCSPGGSYSNWYAWKSYDRLVSTSDDRTVLLTNSTQTAFRTGGVRCSTRIWLSASP